MTQNLHEHRYMVSPCGKHADFYNAGQEPTGWTDATELDDAAVSDLMVRRMMANY